MIEGADPAGDAPLKPQYCRKKVSTLPVAAVGPVQPANVSAAAAGSPLVHGDRSTFRNEVQKKSKRQQKKERTERHLAASQLCHGLLAGTCPHGDSCRYSHDLATYLKTRPADLPGSCPFTATGGCPYGITCRWAKTHASFDTVSAQAFAAHATQNCVRKVIATDITATNASPTTKAASPSEAAVPPHTDRTGDAVVSPPQDANLGSEPLAEAAALAHSSNAAVSSSATDDISWSAASSGGLHRSSEVAAETPSLEVVSDAMNAAAPAGEGFTIAGGAPGHSVHAPMDVESHVSDVPAVPQRAATKDAETLSHTQLIAGYDVSSQPAASPNDASLDALVSNTAALKGDEAWLRSAVVDPVALPVAREVPVTLNVLDKSLQHRLRKNDYDFGKADGILQELGLSLGKHTKAKKNRQLAKQRGDHRAEAEVPITEGSDDGAASVDGDIPAAKRPCPSVSSRQAPSAAQAIIDSVNAQTTDAVAAYSVADETDSAAITADVTAGEAKPLNSAPISVTTEAAAEAEYSGTGPSEGITSGAKVGCGAAAPDCSVKPLFDIKAQAAAGADSPETPLKPSEKRLIDFRGKTYLAPLTTVGNLPFRRLCKGLGVDITCGEMAMATNLCQGQASEWALLKRHPSEDIFGVQVCGGFPDAVARCCQLVDENVSVDFVDINMGCPIDIVCNRGAGSALLLKTSKLRDVVRSVSRTLTCPLTIKLRKGYYDGKDIAHQLLPQAASWGASAATLHGRTRQQRYSRLADWEYVQQCASAVPEGFQLLGNGDVYNWQQHDDHMRQAGVATTMIARAALIKPWIFTEIKEKRHWDISASERLDLLKDFCSFGLTHWGSDAKGVETTRRFLLEWLSFTHRYIPIGLLEAQSQAAQLSWRSPGILGRSYLETLLASSDPQDWVRISQHLLGAPPSGFVFSPKHKARARTEQDMASNTVEDGNNG